MPRSRLNNNRLCLVFPTHFAVLRKSYKALFLVFLLLHPKLACVVGASKRGTGERGKRKPTLKTPLLLISADNGGRKLPIG